MTVYIITPVPAPRMTQSDRWKKRPCVLRYFAFRDEIKANNVTVVSGSDVIFEMPMPKSWSKKKKREMSGKPHIQKPDLDNLLKALLDSIYEDDAHIYKITMSKYWGYVGTIQVF